MRHSFITLAALIAAPLAACARATPTPGPSPAPAPAGPSAHVTDRLVFGRAVPGGGTVSDAAWNAFVRDVVTPRFPAGLSVWRGEGQWRDRTGAVVREPVVVLELFHPADAAADTALHAVAAEYKRRFRQEAVMRVTSPANVRVLDD